MKLLGPVRCFTCGKIFIEENFEKFNILKNKEQKIIFFKNNNIFNYCCRKIFQTTFDIYSE